VEQLRAQVAVLETANQALLEGHARLSTAYLALRLNQVQDDAREALRRLDAAGKKYRELEQRFDELELKLKKK